MNLLFSQIGFSVITLIFFYMLYREFKLALPKADLTEEQKKKFIKRFVTVLIVWFVFIYIWSRSSIMGNFDLFPLNVAPVIILPLIAILIFTFSKPLTEILRHVPPVNLIRLQVFRFYVEVLLVALSIQKLLPVQMTLEGRNFDILTGVSAQLIVFWAAKRSLNKGFLIAWNIICLGLLINIVVIAILSMPSPMRHFMNEPANTIVTEFPISLLPAFLVPLAYMLHFFSLRQLLTKKE